jgi:hypothetical protein
MSTLLMTPLAQKLQIKPGKKWLFYNAPEDYIKSLEPPPESARYTSEPVGDFDGIQLIDVDNKVIILPTEIKRILHQTPQALAYYQQLSYSNKKEYLLWVLTAKQEKTRKERLVKLIEKLDAGRINPSEK